MSLKPLEVTTSKIATKAVTGDKIADSAIETRHIKPGTVTPDKLAFSAVTRTLTRTPLPRAAIQTAPPLPSPKGS